MNVIGQESEDTSLNYVQASRFLRLGKEGEENAKGNGTKPF